MIKSYECCETDVNSRLNEIQIIIVDEPSDYQRSKKEKLIELAVKLIEEYQQKTTSTPEVEYSH